MKSKTSEFWFNEWNDDNHEWMTKTIDEWSTFIMRQSKWRHSSLRTSSLKFEGISGIRKNWNCSVLKEPDRQGKADNWLGIIFIELFPLVWPHFYFLIWYRLSSMSLRAFCSGITQMSNRNRTFKVSRSLEYQKSIGSPPTGARRLRPGHFRPPNSGRTNSVQMGPTRARPKRGLY